MISMQSIRTYRPVKNERLVFKCPSRKYNMRTYPILTVDLWAKGYNMRPLFTSRLLKGYWAESDSLCSIWCLWYDSAYCMSSIIRCMGVKRERACWKRTAWIVLSIDFVSDINLRHSSCFPLAKAYKSILQHVNKHSSIFDMLFNCILFVNCWRDVYDEYL